MRKNRSDRLSDIKEKSFNTTFFARCFDLCQFLDPEMKASRDSLENFTKARHHTAFVCGFDYALVAVLVVVFR